MAKKSAIKSTKKKDQSKNKNTTLNKESLNKSLDRSINRSLNKNHLFIGIAVFWLVLILGFIVVKEYTLQTGEEVLLKTMPVDPRDLFRGDYVILSYEISTLDLNSLTYDVSEFQQGSTVYVTLAIGEGGYGTPIGVFRQRPSEGLFIKGTVRGVGPSTVLVAYGIEHYFVPEGEGLEIERALPGELDVLVAVDKRGNAGIKQLIRSGEIVRFN